MKKYLVKRPDEDVIVGIFPSKEDGKFSFVNLTKGHICKCKFDTVEDALKDMEEQIELGKVLSYEEIKDDIKKRIILICGPSGCGKSYITNKLIETGYFFKLPQYTTRDMRENESYKEYYFITKEHYDVIKDSLVAKTIVKGNRYGTVPIFLENKIGIVIVNKLGIEDFKKYADEKGDIDLFILGIDSTIPAERKDRNEDYVEEERRSLKGLPDEWLFNTEERFITCDDVINLLNEKKFL